MNKIEILTKPKPFLKWAGGKTQLLSVLRQYVPKNYNKYIEPFIGGGAMFFDLCPNKAIISDSNEDLIITYLEIKNNVFELIDNLKIHKNNEEYFYSIRALQTDSLNNLERASRLIYLNKTCFNGLYRVNKKDQFNVPFGKRKNPKICDEDVLITASSLLQNTEIICGDYKTVLRKNAEKGDFIFLDPPYDPVGEYSDFKRYTKDFFYKDDHVELKNEVDRLVNNNCHVILTNSDSDFVLDLFKDFECKVIQTKRMISSNPNSRTGKDLIIIGN